MAHSLSPMLLACVLALASGSALAAAATDERDQQALAAMHLVRLGMRLPAQHLIDAFSAAGYVDDGHWTLKVLREAFLQRFIAELPAAGAPAATGEPTRPALDPRLEQELTGLTAELDAATMGNVLPAFATSLRGGLGKKLQRLVDELGSFINPNLPDPHVEPAPEKRRSATALVETLVKAMTDEFAHSLAKVSAHQADEARMWTLDERNPAFGTILTAACDLRIEALSAAYLGVIVLREVSLRGRAFGIEQAQAAARAFLTAFLGEHGETFGKWDFEFGDSAPYVRLYANVLLGEGVRLGVTGATENEVDSGLQAVIDFATRPFEHDQSTLLEAYHLKLSAWCQLLRWRLALGGERPVAKGMDAWSDFLNRARNDAKLRLPGAPELAAGLGQLHILAARLFHAKGDDISAKALLGMVIAQRPPNPLGENARRWLADLNTSATGGSWSSAPLPCDPGSAITVARAYLAEAAASADPAHQRTGCLNAAVTLRGAVLALASAPDDAIVQFGPATYDLYASALNRLGMRQHAAIVSVEGARTYANYLEARKLARRPNPWLKDGTADQWRDDITTPRKLGLDAASYAEALGRFARKAGPLAEDASAQLRRISPSDFIPQLQLSAIYSALESGDFTGALKETRDLIRESPADDLMGYQLLITIRQRWIDQLARSGGSAETIRRIQDEAAEDMRMILAALDAEVARAPSALRQQRIDSTRGAVLMAQLDSLLAARRYVELMDQVTRMFATARPSDPVLAARALKLACHAAADHFKEASAGGSSTDVAALQADWTRYRGILRCLEALLPDLRKRNVDDDLRAGSQYLAGVMAGVSRQLSLVPGAAAALGSTGADAKRAFADLYEPWIDDRTPPANILFCAGSLWEVAARERAARLYLRYQSALGHDLEVQAFLKEPKPLLDHYGEAVLVRAEFSRPWDEIVDLSYDPPAWLKLYDDGVPAESMPPGVHADYRKAIAAISAFRAGTLAERRAVMDPLRCKAIDAALNGLERLLGALDGNLTAHRRLAQFYRESGQFDLALGQLTFLLAFDSRDPEARLGLIDATRRKMLTGTASTAEIADARALAARLRDNLRNGDRIGYWEAEILVMEFSLALGDTRAVIDTLAFMHRNRSDLSRDLIAPRVDGDDQRVRRAVNAQATELARRFLALSSRTGVAVMPDFRIDLIDAGGTALAIFTDVDAPAFAARPLPATAGHGGLMIIPAIAPPP